MSEKKLGKCEGDCDHDSDCADELVCFQRDGLATVPGCRGTGEYDNDYCIELGINELRGKTLNPNGKLGRCEGDCDDDSECEDGLVCFQRDGLSPVPGCIGEGRYGYDYCFEI